MKVLGDDFNYYLVDCHRWWLMVFFSAFMPKGLKTPWSLFPSKVKLRLATALGGRFSNHQF